MQLTKPRIALLVTGWDPELWRGMLQEATTDYEVVVDPAPQDPLVRYAVVWKQPAGSLARYPSLKAVFSLGAGVDHVFADDDPPDVPIVRVVADDLSDRMAEYVVWHCLDLLRQGPTYRAQQAKGIWHEDRGQPSARDLSVGILGMGEIGSRCAERLLPFGFHLNAWSRTPKSAPGVKSYAGADQLKHFLRVSDIVVSLLPLTQETRGLINADFLAAMKQDGYFGGGMLINAGRGGLQVESDILAALESGVLAHAVLDVFETEPLPEQSPLWDHPKITITPHAAAMSSPKALLPAMVKQMRAHDAGEPLRHVVNRNAGY
ncbi:MAG: glyoxylate/hydroxypyruvate reductase A [Pseudomonadota bacterium]